MDDSISQSQNICIGCSSCRGRGVLGEEVVWKRGEWRGEEGTLKRNLVHDAFFAIIVNRKVSEQPEANNLPVRQETC